jgi:triphosphoribosyl-dephospho-CoA synthase
VSSSRGLKPADFAGALVAGARRELDLTPKPGLVDLRDNGSHPDLNYGAMVRSIELLPIYYEELLMHADGASFDACVRVGRVAEERMFAAIGTNAHKGYIFLSGVVLLASGREAADVPTLRAEIAATARRFFDRVHPGSGRGGIRGETLSGLPCVFDHGLPGYEDGLARTGDPTLASFELMAHLMVHLEDTTAIRRCGPEGLDTLRADGQQLLRILDAGEDPVPHLVGLNDDYRRRNLTMGGVADCMALCFALIDCLPPRRPEGS